MKIQTFLVAIVLSPWVQSPCGLAFQMIDRVANMRTPVKSVAQDRLDEMSEKWESLKEEELRIDMENDPDASMNFAVKMIETAIEHIRRQEQVEEEHVVAVHEALLRVLGKEKALEIFGRVVSDSSREADFVLDMYKSNHFPEDQEKRLELTISGVAHHLQDYVQERISSAKNEEYETEIEEEDIKRELDRLRYNEELLLEVLEDLKELQANRD